jgi:uncharacterized membrane protein
MTRKKFHLFILLVVLVGFYASISFVNHYLLRTYALDLGMFNQALYSFSKGEMNYFTLDMAGNSPIYFADHFSPLTFFYVPFYYLFGNWTLLIIQLFSIIMAGLAVYKIAMLKLNHHLLALFCVIIFSFNWGIVSALAYDFHNNVVATMLLPWVYLWYLKDKKTLVIIGVLLILLAKENMGIWVGFIFSGLAIQKWWLNGKSNQKNKVIFEISIALFAWSYFLFVVSYVMPELSNGPNFQLQRYDVLGANMSEIIQTIFMHPLKTISYFFMNTLGPEFQYFKLTTYIVLILSGGIFLIFRPIFLWMLLPVLAQKMLSSNPGFWGVGSQYSIEFSVIIIFSIIAFLSKMKRNSSKLILVIVVAIPTLGTNFHLVNAQLPEYLDRLNRDYTYESHYNSGGVNHAYIKSKLNQIPNDIPVSSSSCLAPRLERRQKLYHFPIIKDAKYIVLLSKGRSHYPLSDEQFVEKVVELKKSNQFEIVHDKFDLLIFKRKPIK